MKRKLTLLLITMLLSTLAFPLHSFAQESSELETAISTAKAVLNIPDAYDKFDYSMYKEGDRTIYNLSWNDSKDKLGNVRASIDSDGRILSYHSYKPYDDNLNRASIPSVSKADALKVSNDFIQKVNPSLQGKLEYRETNQPGNVNDMYYNFYYTRVENNIPYPQNSVYVSVNNRTGNVQSYSCSFDEGLVFPEANGIITLEKAQEYFINKLGLKLVYKMSYGNDERVPYLVYTNVYDNSSIDAKTGEIVNNALYYGMYDKGGMGSPESTKSVSNSGAELTPEEKKAVENASNFMDEKKAESIARKSLKLDSNFKLNSINLFNSGMNKGDYIWSMHFNKEDKKNGITIYYNASISIDARTGEVMNFYRYSPDKANAKVKYNKDQSVKIAEDFIKSMQPEKFSEAEYTDWNEPVVKPLAEKDQPRQYYFRFTRKVGSIYFLENGFNVTVDATTGSVIDYNFNWYKGELPSSDKALTLEEAHKILFDKVGLQLQYIPDYSNTLNSKIAPSPYNGLKPDIKLVYALKAEKPSNIDAVTGKLLDYAGNPYEEKTVVRYSDIGGHYAEKQINMLAEYGISLPGSEFKPDQDITQKEFLYLLQKSINPYVTFKLAEDSKDDDALYNQLINSGIIKENEKSPTSIVTKQDMVKFLIRSLKFDKVADIKGIYSLPFKDKDKINPELYGYTAIAYGLNIIKTDDGNFNPSANITRAEAAIALYNLLNIN